MDFRSAYRRLFVVFLVLVGLCPVAGAQQRDFGTELTASYGRDLWRGGSITLGEKVRLVDMSTRYSKSKTSVTVSQSLLRSQLRQYDMRLRVGAGYTFINLLDGDDMRYYNQQRLMVQALLAKDYGFWRFGARVRLQSTWRDELRGSYRYNPKLCLRGRLQAAYAFPDKPWKLAAYSEWFYRANRGQFVDEMRNTVSVTRLLDRHQSLTLFLRHSQELQVANPLTIFYLGLSYDFE